MYASRISIIKNSLPDDKNENRKTLNKEEIEKSLDKIGEAIDNFDSNAEESVDELLSKIRTDGKIYVDLKKLKDQLENYDFDNALIQLNKIKNDLNSN